MCRSPKGAMFPASDAGDQALPISPIQSPARNLLGSQQLERRVLWASGPRSLEA